MEVQANLYATARGPSRCKFDQQCAVSARSIWPHPFEATSIAATQLLRHADLEQGLSGLDPAELKRLQAVFEKR